MYGKANFRTEYKSKYKEHDPKKVTGSTSPILKPRDKNETESKTEMVEKARSEAGLVSSETHNIREPPLQHRRIVLYDKNHNILSTSTTEQILENGVDTGKKKNPILEYDAELQKLRKDEQDKEKRRVKMKSKRSPKRKVSFDDSKYAGKPSELVRFKAFEPPLQRKRISPSRGNHNILRTNTVNYINGSDTTTEDIDDMSTVASASNGSIDHTRKKLVFEYDESKNAEPKEKVFEPGKTFVVPSSRNKELRNGDNQARDKKSKVVVVEKSPIKSPLSPQKLQRKNDLKEMEKKQSERVSRSLQIKAGLRNIDPPLYSHPVKTEYQRQFLWKDGYRFETPVLSADQMVSRSDPDVIPRPSVAQTIPRPSVTKTIPKRSEYMSQFVEYPTMDAEKENYEEKENNTKYDENFDASKVNDKVKEKKKGKHKKPNGERKTKFKGLSPEKMPPAGSPSRTSVDDKRLIMPSRNIQPFFFPHGEHRKFLTEYKANFRSPTKYAIESGAWQGVDPPHLQSDKWESESNRSDWFKEVIHLREKADQFKSRERETHFASTHLDWLDEEQDELLERASKQSSLSTQSERGEEEESNVDEPPLSSAAVNERTSVADSHEATHADPGADGVERDEESNENDNESLEASSNSDQVITSSVHGRLPTARLKQASEHRRHHLDRTTPHTGGAILSSPIKRRGKRQSKPLQTHKKIPAPQTEQPYPILAWDEKLPQSHNVKIKKGSTKEPDRTHVSKGGATYNSKKYQGELYSHQNEYEPNKEFTQYKNQDHDRSFRQSLREASNVGENNIYESDNYEDKNDGPVIITSETSSLEDILQTDHNTRKTEISKCSRPPRAFAEPIDDGTITLESDGGSIEDVRRSDSTHFLKTKRTMASKQIEDKRKDRYAMSTPEFSSVVEGAYRSDVDHNEKQTKARNVYMPPRSFVVPTERERPKGLSKQHDEEIEDLLSESSMSARSLLASDTLEKAKGRRTNFWK